MCFVEAYIVDLNGSVYATMSVQPNSPWTPEAIAILVRMRSEGRPFSAIAEALGPPFNRNMVASRAQREKLPTATNPPFQKTPAPPRPKPELAAPAPPPASEPVSLFDLTFRSCRWPFGDVPPFLFCGEPRDEGYAGPYCPAHRQRAIGSARVLGRGTER